MPNAEPSDGPAVRPATDSWGYAAERQQHGNAIGRDSLVRELDQWLLGDDDHWVVVVARFGIGKTALMMKWLEQREAHGAVVPHHFIRRNDRGRDDPARIMASLAAQVETLYPAQRLPNAAPDLRLTELLERVSTRELVPHNKHLVLLLDGLDEYDAPTDDNDPLAAFLPRALPRIRVLCASRSKPAYLDSLVARGGDLIRIDLEALEYKDDNAATVRSFWQREAPRLGLDDRFVDAAVAAAGDNMQHAVMLKRHLASTPPAQRRIEIPRGLESLLEQIWRRMMSQPVAVEGLGALCAAREPLSLDQIGRAVGWEHPKQRQVFKDTASELLTETRRADGTGEYRLHHDATREHIIGAIGGDALRRHHASLARTLAAWPVDDLALRGYALRHALAHRAGAGNLVGVRELAGDLEFFEAKCREFGVDELEADLARTADQCRADNQLFRTLGELVRAVARESHWIRAYPDALAAQLWNRLRRIGWSSSQIDGWLRIPSRCPEFVRVRRAVSRESGELVRDLVPHSAVLSACVVMRDGRHVAAASRDGMIRVWETDTSRVIATLDGGARSPKTCAVSPDGNIASATAEHAIEIRGTDGSGFALPNAHRDRVESCVFASDSQHVISASADQTLKVWHIASRKLVGTLEGHRDLVNCCAVASGVDLAVSGSDDGTLKVWRFPSGEPVRTLVGHCDGVTSCVVFDGRIVSCSYDKTLKVWDLGSGELLRTLEGHTDWVTSCAVTPDGRVVSASHDHTLRLWELGSGELLRTLEGHSDWVTSCAVTHHGRSAVSASADRTIKLWDIGRAAAPTSSDRELGSSSASWIIGASTPVTSLRDRSAAPSGHLGRVRSCAVIPERRWVVSASDDRTLRTWDLDSGESIGMLSGHTSRVADCAVFPGGHRVVSASSDHTLKVWDLDDREHHEVSTFTTPARVTCCVPVSDGRVVCASEHGGIELRRVDTGDRAPLGSHARFVNRCVVTPDGKHLVSASDDRTLKIWELDSGRNVGTLTGHSADVMGCAVTPDGKRIVSASDDGTLKVWEFDTGRELRTLTDHTAWVLGCAIAPDGRHAISASGDGTLRIWDLTTYQCVATHRGEQQFSAVVATDTTICAGDAVGTLWFLDWPRSLMPLRTPSVPGVVPTQHRQVILFLAANPSDSGHLGLDREHRAIDQRLGEGTCRDHFVLETGQAVTVDDIVKLLRRKQPSVVHFCGHGVASAAIPRNGGTVVRNIEASASAGVGDGAIWVDDGDGGHQRVTAAALRQMIESTAGSVRLVVLNACYSDALAYELCHAVDCVIGMAGAIEDGAAQSFAAALYSALADGVSVGEAFAQACATLRGKGLVDAQLPRCKTRDGVDARALVLAGPARP